MSRVVDIALPTDAEALLDALVSRGHFAAVVGGAVRDALLERIVGDLDVVTAATPDGVRESCEGTTWCQRTYAVGERYGTIGVVLADGTVVEVSQLRGADFAEDASRRDFTINALGAAWPGLALLDAVGGLADLDAGILRAPGEPSERFAEDPLRVLRAARFVADLGFVLDPATEAAAAATAPLLADVSAERVRDELTALLLGEQVGEGLSVALRTGALAEVLPEVAALDGVTQPTFHDLDVFAHTVQTVDSTPAIFRLRWAALLHDVGKGPCRTVEPDGRIRFFRHAKIGAEMTARICERLRFSKAQSRAVTHLVAEHMRLGDLVIDNPRAVDRAVRRLDLWASSSADAVRLASAEDAVDLTMADFAATAHRADAPAVRTRLDAAVRASRGRGTRTRPGSVLGGTELMRELGLPEGPCVGDAQRAIEEAVAHGELRADDRPGALRVARSAVARGREGRT
ncbi:MAG: HD domain-containing protein [Coriobacteriia bacterium]|nr:HD domain-containing protein [Coriobacteriia bacterium]